MFLYYLPESGPQVSREKVEELGLGYAFDQITPSCGQVTRGPEGQGAGAVFANEQITPAQFIKFLPEQQQWRQIPGCEAWVGYWTARRPGPEHLAKPANQRIAGYAVRLGDGRSWEIPIARGWLEEDGQVVYTDALPTALTFNAQGKWERGGIKPAYRRLQQVAAEYFDARAGAEVEDDGEKIKLRFNMVDDSANAAITALQANYYIGPAEADELGLLDETNVGQVLEALIDMRALLELQKKRLAAFPASAG